MADNRVDQVCVSATPSAASQTPVPNMPVHIDHYLNEGLEGVKRQQYRDVHTFARSIKSQTNELRSGNLNAGQYVVFSPVSPDQLKNLVDIRDDHYKSLRFLYLSEAETLIVKIMPGPTHQEATGELADRVKEKIRVMGLRRDVRDMGGTTYQASQSSNEADSAIRPTPYRPCKTDWPTVVFECGVLESLRRLRTDAYWWLENSAHNVKIALIICVSKPQQKIHLEQWEGRTIPNPRITSNNENPRVTRATKINEINIDGNTVTGAPLRLAFDKVFLRPPAPGEGDIVLIAQDLRDYADDVWTGV